MTWPTGPPPMPPSGWYDDPERPSTWRWWDGARWTEHRATMAAAPVRDPRSFAAWFDRSVTCMKVAVRRVGVSLLVVWLTLAVMGWWFAVATLDSDRGRELRRLLAVDQGTFGPTGSSVTAELTNEEAERAWQLIREIVASVWPWLVVLGLAVVVAAAWSVAAVARVAARHVADPDGTELEPRGSVALAALRRVPAVLAAGVVVSLLVAVVWALISLPVALVAALDGGGAAILLTVVFAVLLAAVVTPWLWGRLALSSVIAAVGGHGVGVRRSWELTRGRFWFVVGRLLVTGLVAGAVNGAVNAGNSFTQFLGVAVFLAIVLLTQAVAFVAAMIITVCAHVVTIDQVESQQAELQQAASSPTGS